MLSCRRNVRRTSSETDGRPQGLSDPDIHPVVSGGVGGGAVHPGANLPRADCGPGHDRQRRLRVACALLELPTSGFADALRRKPVYLTAAVLNVVVGLLYLQAHSFAAFTVAAALMGVIRALDSGPLEAWFVDTIHETEPGTTVERDLGRAGTVLGLGIAAGSVLAGLLVWWHPVKSMPAIDLPVTVFAGMNVVHLIACALLIKESPRGITGGRWERALHSARQAFCYLPALNRGRGEFVARGVTRS